LNEHETCATPDRPGRRLDSGLYDVHGARLFGYALLILADRAAAEDAVQQVFSSMLESRLTRESILSPGDYLRRAVRNECYTILRRRRRGAVSAEDDGRLVEARPGQVADHDDRIAVSRLSRGCLLTTRGCPPQGLRRHDVLEIGKMLDIPANTAASRYRYALARLREMLAPADDTGSGQS